MDKRIYAFLRNEIGASCVSLVAGGVCSKIITKIFANHTKKIYASGVMASLFVAERILFWNKPAFLAEEIVKGHLKLKDAFIRGESTPLLIILFTDHFEWSQENLDFPFFLEHRERIQGMGKESRQKVINLLQGVQKRHPAFSFLGISQEENWFFKELLPWQEHYLQNPVLLDQLMGDTPSNDYGNQALFWWGKLYGLKDVPEPNVLPGSTEAKEFLKRLAKYQPQMTLKNSELIIDFI